MKLYKRSVNDPAPLGQADPFIFTHGGKYYVYATHVNGVQLYVSDSLTGDYEFKGYCYTREGRDSYWAPSVIEIDGKIYMYVSNVPTGCDDAHQQTMQVAVADSPEGPFTYLNDLIAPFSIDSHVVEYKGSYYIFYSINDEEAERAGTLIVCDKMVSPTEVEGKPVIVVRPSLDEEIYMKNRFRQGQHWHTIEGAFYFKEGDTHFVHYSGSSYGRPTYFVGYAVAHGDPEDLRDLDWHKYPDENTYNPLLSANDFIEGTGHNSVIKEDGQWYIIYHGRDMNEEKKPEDTRSMRIDKMMVDGDVLTVEITP